MWCSWRASYLFGDIAHANHARLHDFRVDTAQVELAPQRRVDKLHRVDSEPRDELFAAGVRLRRHFDHRGADGEPRPWRQVLDTEVQVDEQLIAGQVPALTLLRDQRNRRGRS